MVYEVRCNRCGEREPLQFYNIDIGYWGHPVAWLKVDGDTHLCPDCKDLAIKSAAVDGEQPEPREES